MFRKKVKPLKTANEICALRHSLERTNKQIYYLRHDIAVLAGCIVGCVFGYFLFFHEG